jgi:hypothetical protein
MLKDSLGKCYWARLDRPGGAGPSGEANAFKPWNQNRPDHIDGERQKTEFGFRSDATPAAKQATAIDSPDSTKTIAIDMPD